MDKVINCLFAAITLLLSARGEVFQGKDHYLEMIADSEHMLSFCCMGMHLNEFEDDVVREFISKSCVCACKCERAKIAPCIEVNFKYKRAFYALSLSDRRAQSRRSSWSLFLTFVAAVRTAQLRHGAPPRLSALLFIQPQV